MSKTLSKTVHSNSTSKMLLGKNSPREKHVPSRFDRLRVKRVLFEKLKKFNEKTSFEADSTQLLRRTLSKTTRFHAQSNMRARRVRKKSHRASTSNGTARDLSRISGTCWASHPKEKCRTVCSQPSGNFSSKF